MLLVLCMPGHGSHCRRTPPVSRLPGHRCRATSMPAHQACKILWHSMPAQSWEWARCECRPLADSPPTSLCQLPPPFPHAGAMPLTQVVSTVPAHLTGIRCICRLPRFAHWALDARPLPQRSVVCPSAMALAVGLSDNAVELFSSPAMDGPGETAFCGRWVPTPGTVRLLRVQCAERSLLYSMSLRVRARAGRNLHEPAFHWQNDFDKPSAAASGLPAAKPRSFPPPCFQLQSHVHSPLYLCTAKDWILLPITKSMRSTAGQNSISLLLCSGTCAQTS
jgi:hypothetical protein